MSVTSDPLSDPAHAAALRVLAAARDEIARADQKASLLIAAAGVVAGALLAALLSSDWSPSRLNNAVEWLWWAGIVALLAGLGWLGAAVFPRLDPKDRSHDVEHVAFFGDVIAGTRSSLQSRLEASLTNPSAEAIDQLWQVSLIAKTKYHYVQRGLLGLAASAALTIIAVVLDFLFR